jgi:hypothetical protein
VSAQPRGLAEADAALARWRALLAAASRNVVELSELPAFLALKSHRGSGRTAAAAASLVATMDELWQGVLLIGAAIDRADTARHGGSRLWRGDEAAAEALAILDGESIEIATADLPVLNRGLLASARATIRVTPQRLLDAMEQAFERAKASIESLDQAFSGFTAAQSELAGMIDALAASGWPGAAAARARLAAEQSADDPLGARERIEAMRPELGAALAAFATARRELAEAQADCSSLATLRQRLEATAATCRQATDVAVALPDPQTATDLAAWLERLTKTLEAGQLDSLRVGLTRWRDLAARLRADTQAALATAAAAIARRDELRGRFGALRAKQAARLGADQQADAAASQLQAALFGAAARLAEAERLMPLYEAILARPAAAKRSA